MDQAGQGKASAVPADRRADAAAGPVRGADGFTALQARLLCMAGTGTFLILLTGLLYFASGFFLPLVLALLFGLVLRPVVRRLDRNGVPPGVSAVALVLVLAVAATAIVHQLSGPVAEWVEDAPRIGAELRLKLHELRQSVAVVQQVSEEIRQAADGGGDPRIQQVVVQDPGLLSRVATGLPDLVARIALCLVLLLFLLASGDLFLEKLVRILPTMRDKVQALRIARDVEAEISHYLLTVTLINAGLGLGVGAALALAGMPNPLLWGVMAALLNFLPYIGTIIGVGLVAAVALVSFDGLGAALVAPGLYLALTIVEGQLVTPLVLGRRLRLNPVAIVTAVALWAFLWGIAGAIIAVPLLIVTKVLADHVTLLGPLGEFISGRHAPAAEDQRSAAASAEKSPSGRATS